MDKNILFSSKQHELILEHLYTVEDYFTFNIQVKSGVFAGASNFCLPKEKICSLIKELSVMSNKLEGNCRIEDSDSDAFLVMEMDNLGHISFYGQIGGSHEDHYLKFRYTIDQTVLINLVRVFKVSL